MSDIAKGWQLTKLGEVASLKTGPFGSTLHKTDYINGGIPLINPTHIQNGNLMPAANVSVSAKTSLRLSEYQLNEGDIVMGRRGEMGRCAVVPYYANGWICGTGSVVVKSTAAISPRYLQRILTAPATVATLVGDSVGSTMVNLNQGVLFELNVPIAPLAEQRRISDKLDTLLARIDGCRDRLDRVPKIIKQFRQTVLDAATSGRLTEEWRDIEGEHEGTPVQLRAVATSFSYGSSAKSARTGKVPVLRMGNIQNGRLDWSDLVFTSDESEINKYKLQSGDVLFNRTNSPELVGKTAVFKGERESIYAGYLIRVRCSVLLLPDYLNYCLNSPAGREFCWQVKSDGVSQSNINAKKLADFVFQIPSIKEQKEIIRRVEHLFALADRLEARVKSARARVDMLTPATLAKAFRGELVPQNPNDEPASVLLDRIRAERAANPATSRQRRSSKS